MRTTSAPVEVVGRDNEVAAAETFLGSLRYGPAALVLEGEAGIGKTTVWRAAVDAAHAHAYGVLVARPSESEAALSFLALADLLEEVSAETLESLPDPQRAALEAALSRTGAEGPSDRVALARGALNVLRALAAERPVVVAIDDVQWLDASSGDALRFLFRRLGDERVGLLGSVRSEGGAAPLEIDRALPPERLHRAVLRSLSFTDLVHVVRAHRDVSFTRPTWRAIHRISGGNPLFAIQLSDALAARGTSVPVEQLALPETLGAAVSERLETLSPDARRTLLEVALLAQPTPSLVDSGEGLAEALEAGVLELDGDRLRFRHPLLASAVQSAASPGERRAAHCRLASIVEDPEEQALHLGRGTTQADERVAATLEQAADRARWRGLAETAAELAERAEQLTPPDRREDAARRAVAAARQWSTAGDAVRSREVLDRLIETLPPGQPRAVALSLLGFIFDDVASLEQALEEAVDDDLLAVIQADLSEVEIRRGLRERSYAHARAAVDLAERSGDSAALAKALATLALRELHASPDHALALLERGAALEQTLPEQLPVTNSPAVTRGFVLLGLDRLDEARVALEETYQRALALGHIWRSIPLGYLSELECRVGDWDRALAYALEAQELGRQWGLASAEAWTLHARALVDAHLGNVDSARAAGTRAVELARETGSSYVLGRVESTLGFLDLSLGDFESAWQRLGATQEFGAAADSVEALLGLGRVEAAEQLAGEVERRAERRGLPSRLAAAARAQALVLGQRGDFAGAGVAIERAFAAHARLEEPFELGRTLLAQGVIERRAKRRAEARAALARACSIFEQLGARLWLDRARQELERTGLRRASDELSPTEEQVAELAAGGATNKEIAGALFLSVKTVESNLSRVYRKLDVRSRTELAARLTKAS